MRQGTTAKHCGRHYGKKTPRQDTAAKIHCGTVARKCDVWQESATCVMALRHATATKPKKKGVGGGVHEALRIFERPLPKVAPVGLTRGGVLLRENRMYGSREKFVSIRNPVWLLIIIK